MIKKWFALLLLIVIPCLAQTGVNETLAEYTLQTDSLIAQRLALDTSHAYDPYYNGLIEMERNQEGIALNVVGITIGAVITAMGGLLVTEQDFVIPGMTCLVAGPFLLFSNIRGIGESRDHSKRRMEYENIYGLYKNKRSPSLASMEIDTSLSASAIDSLVAEQLALDPSYDYSSYYRYRIQTEDSQGSIGENIFAAIVGAGAAGLGVAVMYSVSSSDALTKALAYIFGVPLLVSGGSLLVYNIYAIDRDVGHKHRRDDTKRAYELYKNKRGDSAVAAKFFLTPTFNVATNGAGMNLFVVF